MVEYPDEKIGRIENLIISLTDLKAEKAE